MTCEGRGRVELPAFLSGAIGAHLRDLRKDGGGGGRVSQEGGGKGHHGALRPQQADLHLHPVVWRAPHCLRGAALLHLPHQQAARNTSLKTWCAREASVEAAARSKGAYAMIPTSTQSRAPGSPLHLTHRRATRGRACMGRGEAIPDRSEALVRCSPAKLVGELCSSSDTTSTSSSPPSFAPNSKKQIQPMSSYNEAPPSRDTFPSSRCGVGTPQIYAQTQDVRLGR